MMNDVIFPCILSSAVIATLISSIKEVVLWFLNRKAKVNDDAKADEKEDIKSELSILKEQIVELNDEYKDLLEELSAHVTCIEKTIETSVLSNRLLLEDRIEYISLVYIERGKISYGSRKTLHDLWNMYHYQLGGNGDLDDIMERIDKLPLEI